MDDKKTPNNADLGTLDIYERHTSGPLGRDTTKSGEWLTHVGPEGITVQRLNPSDTPLDQFDSQETSALNNKARLLALKGQQSIIVEGTDSGYLGETLSGVDTAVVVATGPFAQERAEEAVKSRVSGGSLKFKAVGPAQP